MNTTSEAIVRSRLNFNELLINFLKTHENELNEFDIIHAHGFMGLVICYIKRYHNIPITSTIHSIEKARPQREKYLGQYHSISGFSKVEI